MLIQSTNGNSSCNTTPRYQNSLFSPYITPRYEKQNHSSFNQHKLELENGEFKNNQICLSSAFSSSEGQFQQVMQDMNEDYLSEYRDFSSGELIQNEENSRMIFHKHSVNTNSNPEAINAENYCSGADIF